MKIRNALLAVSLSCLLFPAGALAGDDGGSDAAADAATANLSLGTAYLRKGNFAVAKDKLERAHSQNPRDVQVLLALALLYQTINEPSKADATYREALRVAPGNPEVLNNYAVYQCRNGKVNDALKRFEQAANNKLYTTPWAAWTNAGVCLRSAKRDADAEERFARALSANPVYSEAVLQQAELELESQRLPAAWQRLAVYLNTNPASPELLYLAWRVARAGKDDGNAERMAHRLQTEFPGSGQAKLVAAESPAAAHSS